MKFRLLALAVLILGPLATSTSGHIGNPTTIHEGFAGAAPVRVSVKVPGVVPGLAEINVRVLTNGVKRVTALPVHWRAGLKGAPPADVCEPVLGEPGLYHAELWLMEHGAFSVDVVVETERGSGRISVPINALAMTRLPMARFLGALLSAMGVLLFVLAVSAVGAAVRESVVEPGLEASRRRVWIGRAGTLGAAVMLSLSLYGGWTWWQKVDGDYRNNRMHQPLPASAETRLEGGRRFLRFTLLTKTVPRSNPARWTPLVPDHGKLMHLFMLREPDMAAFAHLHPARAGTNTFEAALPALPAGEYSVYADITHESGLSQTLTAKVSLTSDAPTFSGVLSDPDDSWFVGPSDSVSSLTNCSLGDGFTMTWDRSEPLVAGRETTLRFRARDPHGAPADVEPYMSMLAHAVVRRDDGSVFTHLHPAGNISVASQQVFQLRSGEKPPRRITPEMMEKLCQPPGPELRRLPIAFPYEFPKPGRYRIWVQVKLGGLVRTAVFDADVKPTG